MEGGWLVDCLGALKVSVPRVERSLGEAKEQKQPFRIPGEKGQSFMHRTSIQASIEPAQLQEYKNGYDTISDLQL